jgi:2-oxoglutarate dehydrogenase E2 component (dihydrolipoamide succinyltransferase)
VPEKGCETMSQIEILLPKMGESVAEATIIKWLKNEGDRVEADEPIVEIATDKVDSEVPAPEAGILLKRLVNEGDVVKVGQPIAQIGSAVGAAAEHLLRRQRPVLVHQRLWPLPTVVPLLHRWDHPARSNATDPAASSTLLWCATSPRAKGSRCRNWKPSWQSGQGGRVTKKDILDYLPNRAPGATAGLLPATNAPLSFRCDLHRGYQPLHPAGRPHGGHVPG